jgi:ElaB/YqjD/DUF883 family membrane-anchored ribosome-binding protein
MGQAPTDDVKALGAVEREVDLLRERTETLIEELERRIGSSMDRARATVNKVKHAVDVPTHVRTYPRASAGIGVGTAVAIGLGIWMSVRRRREANRPMNRMRRKAIALRAILADPERVLRGGREPIGRRVLGAVLVTAATVVVRALATRMARPIATPLTEPRHARQLPAPELPAV